MAANEGKANAKNLRQVPVPRNEVERMAALRSYAILDTASEIGFDELVSLASQICETPMAAISLIDAERQWFKARVGFEATQTPRDIAFCAHGIAAKDDLFVVPDAAEDARFANSPLVVEPPHIRFYAGAQLVNAEGCALGMLCVMDHQARRPSETQLESLRMLARQVVSQMELRRELRAHNASRQGLAASQRELHEWTAIVNRSPAVAFLARAEDLGPLEYISDNVSQWGYAPLDFLAQRLTYKSIVHPDDFASIWRNAFQRSAMGEDRFHQEYRILTSNGNVRWVADHMSVRRDAAGNASHFEGILLDITAQVEAQTAAREMSERHAFIVNNLKEVVFQVSPDGCWTFLNRAWTEIMGFSIEQSLGTRFIDYVHPEDRDRCQLLFTELMERKKDHCRNEVRYRTLSGEFRWIEVFVRLTLDAEGRILGAAGTLYDLTKRKLAQDKLRESEALYHSLVAHLPLFILRKDAKGRITFANRRLCEALRFPLEAVIGKTDSDFLPPDVAQHLREADEKVLASGNAINSIEELPDADGLIRHAQIITTPICGSEGEIAGVQVISWDVSERHRFECQLRDSLAEKEILLKEIHHRVKNNMQLICSLLSLQADVTQDERLRISFAESQNRISSMALIHEKLYQSTDIARVDFGEYLRDLVEGIAASNGSFSRRVETEVQTDDLRIGVDAAIPCGLIVNELVSNAFKHGFPSGGKGKISVVMRRETEGLRLIISDTGRGIDERVDFMQSKSLGMKLVLTLVRQLRGEIKWRNHEGTTFELLLKEARPAAKSPHKAKPTV
ncbi:MAG: PAS domain S-box protein [Limisphaerales bacterium]